VFDRVYAFARERWTEAWVPGKLLLADPDTPMRLSATKPKRKASCDNSMLWRFGNLFPRFDIAGIQVGLGEIEAALPSLEKAYDARDREVARLLIAERMNALDPTPVSEPGTARWIAPIALNQG